jgi:hypothetical protein
MPENPTREAEIKKQVEREFGDMERALQGAGPGVLDVLQVYGACEDALRQADMYLNLLNPVSASFSTTSGSNIEN